MNISKMREYAFMLTYELEIKGAGPIALKVSLFLSYKSIETLDKPVENILKLYLAKLKIFLPQATFTKHLQEML